MTECDNDAGANRSARHELEQFLANSERSYVITNDEYERELAEQFPGRLRLIFSRPRFLAPGKMLVFVSSPKSSPPDME